MNVYEQHSFINFELVDETKIENLANLSSPQRNLIKLSLIVSISLI